MSKLEELMNVIDNLVGVLSADVDEQNVRAERIPLLKMCKR